MKITVSLCLIVFLGFIFLPVFGMYRMESFADDWYESEESTSFDYAALAGIKNVVDEQKNSTTASFTPKVANKGELDVASNNVLFEKEERMALTASQNLHTQMEYAQGTKAMGISPSSDVNTATIAIKLDPGGYNDGMEGAEAGEDPIGVGTGSPPPAGI
ncbi:MAG: hypothetical protein PHH49_05670 [Candidatus Omnitrophica bacterium]|nr:hypothetical protein [Candidatus Omnitrophota bacterium]MDD5488431.1 hypothetical protein [Candidatus Omnitrophota bacterium]